jgi:pimeloyl-ACP methyl ester carboxylesterase
MKLRAKIWLTIAGLFVLLNVVAYRHAWRMTHFVPAGNRTAAPHKLSAFGQLKVLLTGVTIPKSNGGMMTNTHRNVTFTTCDGIKLAAWDVPAMSNHAVAIIFHGYATSKSVLRSEAAILREFGLRTVLVDFRGAGDSEGWVTTVGWNEALDVAAAADWVRREYPGKPVILYGQSMGAAAVLRAISEEGVRPEGIVLECPYDRFLTTVGHRYELMHLPAFPFAHLLLTWGGMQHGFNAFRLNPVTYAKKVSCPALVMDGANDPWVKAAEARRVALAMKGPTQCVIFTNGSHGGFWWDVGDEYQKTLGDWLRQIKL